MASPGGDERLDDASAADAEARVDALDARLEVVVERDRHDADREAEGGGDQRLGDAAGDHAEAARAGDRHAVEGAHDAEHRAEQPDERRRRADRRQHPEGGGGALRLLELPLLGDALELRYVGRAVAGEHAGVDAAGGTGAVSLDQLAGSAEAGAGERSAPRSAHARSSATATTITEQASRG